VSLVYRTKRGGIEALSNLTLRICTGEFVSILGPSGCGKSTFLKIASGLLPPTRGTVILNGAPVTRPSSNVGVVFQKPTLMPWKTVLQNTLVAAESLHLDLRRSQKVALEYLRLVGLEKFVHNYPYELSGGMQQRVGIVRGLVHDPDVLLMDEPFGALDAMTREHMILELQKLWMAAQKSVIFITHSIPEAVFLSDRVIVLSERPGRVVKEAGVKIPRPRDIATMASAEFGSLCKDLREHFSQFVLGA
jgi:NitT/TauT family transport system ATP-binding protein